MAGRVVSTYALTEGKVLSRSEDPTAHRGNRLPIGRHGGFVPGNLLTSRRGRARTYGRSPFDLPLQPPSQPVGSARERRF